MLKDGLILISTLGNTLVNLGYMFILVVLIIGVKCFGHLVNEKQLIRLLILLSPLLVVLFRFNIRYQLVLALITWYFFMLGLFVYFHDVNKLPLVYAFCVFYSEFYELPIYVSRWFRGVKILNSTPLFILLRLSVLFFILYELKEYNYNYKKYIEHLVKMFCLSIPFCWYLLHAGFQGYDLIMILKLYCFIGLIYYLINNNFYSRFISLLNILNTSKDDTKC